MIPIETRRVVILTALSLEYKAIRTHLKNIREKTHPRGTVYEEGRFVASDGSPWEVYIAEIGAGNSTAARETERAISHFSPEIVVFVGVAGGLKDVVIGDVVVATKVYGYESGKAKREFRPRPQVHETAYALQQRSRAEAKREDWFKRVGTGAKRKFKVFVAPIVSGEKVLASQRSALSAFLRDNYGDALAVEMEGWGFLDAVHASADVLGLIVRGISDLVDGKSKADAAGSQVRAAKHASAFAFEVLSKWGLRGLRTSGGVVPETSGTTDISEEAQADEAKGPSFPPLQRSARIDELIKGVVLDDNRSSVAPAIEIVKATDELGHNELLQELLNYLDYQDQDTLWKALPTIEACAELAPRLFTHAVLSRMTNNSDFSVRSSAASICMDLAQYAPDRVPVDLLIKLSVHNEDWYVETPAIAALKAMVRSMPAVLGIFFARLRSEQAEERTHAAQALAEIAKREPEVLDPDALKKELSRLRFIGDKDATALIARVLPRVRRSRRIDRYKYGL
jgi:nucleoside phosphorylase